MATQPPTGGGQSGYGAGRTGDRALGPGYRNPEPPDAAEPTGWGAPNRTGYHGVGEHRGKGPRGYTRSDDRIKEHVHEALTDDPHVDATHIEVVVHDGEVILTGTVEDRRQKRLAEDCIEDIVGITDIHNQLRLRSNPIGGGEV